MNTKQELRSPLDAHGVFWRPGNETVKFPGRLLRGADQNIQLVTSPVLNEVSAEVVRSLFEGDSIEVLHGFTTLGFCALFWLHCASPKGLTDFRTAYSLTFREYRVGLCVFGALLPHFDVPAVDSASFKFSGIHKWIGLQSETVPIDGGSQIITKSKRTVFDVWCPSLESNVKLEISPDVQLKAGGEYECKADCQLRIEPSGRRSLEWFLQVAYRLEHFFSLLLGTKVALEAAVLHEGEQEAWLMRKAIHKSEEPDISVWVRCDFAQLAQAVLRWLEMPDAFRPLETLVYGTIMQSSMFVETEFLSLSQALESYHRLTDDEKLMNPPAFEKLLESLRTRISELCSGEIATRLNESIRYANEPALRTRITRLLWRLKEEHRDLIVGDAMKFERTIRKTRNYFTHPGTPKNTDVLTTPHELFLMNQKLHALLRLLMLVQIGLSADEVFEPVHRQASQWH